MHLTTTSQLVEVEGPAMLPVRRRGWMASCLPHLGPAAAAGHHIWQLLLCPTLVHPTWTQQPMSAKGLSNRPHQQQQQQGCHPK
jgi:hypothetical protein